MLAKDVTKEQEFIVPNMMSDGVATKYCRTIDAEVLIYDGTKMVLGIMAKEISGSQGLAAFPSETELTLIV